jgi:hypothetical protein
MKAAFLKEQKRYTRAELVELLGSSDERFANAIRRLKEFGILKTVRSSDAQKDMADLAEEEVGVVDTGADADAYYLVTFVGLVVVGGFVLKCVPKYLADDSNPADKLAQVLKVLEKYNAREQVIRMFSEPAKESQLNLLSAMRFLLRDYHEYGAYNNSQDAIETNGSGDINWDRTINDTFALLIRGRPHYVNLRTRKRLEDDRDFFRRLHLSVLTQFTQQLQDADLLVLLDIPGVDGSDEAVDALGDTDYLLYRIEAELSAQFNTRKQLVLQAIYSYLSQRVTLGEVDGFSAFGSNSFNLVWQTVCSSVIGSQLASPLSALPLPTPLKPRYGASATLQSLIDKPQWTGTDEAGNFSLTSDKTLIPDLAAIFVVSGKHELVILDAKYYTLQLHRQKTLLGQPGIGDVTKQYLYQLAFREFTDSHGITDVRNCFLLPTDGPDIIQAGSVSLDMLRRLRLEDIQIRLLPATEMYDLYLHGKQIDIARLGL